MFGTLEAEAEQDTIPLARVVGEMNQVEIHQVDQVRNTEALAEAVLWVLLDNTALVVNVVKVFA